MRKEHILVIRFSAMGDVAIMVPVVWSLAQQDPDARTTELGRKYMKVYRQMKMYNDPATNPILYNQK